MPTSTSSHWEYTLNEWSQDPFTRLLNALPFDLDVVFDLGANVGGWTKVMQDRYPNATFYCFEPVAENFAALSQNVEANHIQFGIFYGARESHAVSRGDKNVGGIFIEQIEAGEPRVFHDEVVQLRTLEELDLPKPELIKMDVEGAEENIIEHSKIVKETPWLIIEWHPPTDPYEFFKKHLPNHGIVIDLDSKQFLLCSRS